MRWGPRYQLLSPSRLARTTRPTRGRRIEWRVSLRVRNRFRELLGELVDLEHQDPAANHARILALQDDIRHLPGYPQRYDPENDTIVPVTTTAQR